MHISRNMGMINVRAVAVVCAAILSASCIDSHEAPDLSGPSGFGQSLTMTASPDTLPRDGVAQSVVTINFHDTTTDTPLAGRALRLATTAGSLSAAQVVTDAGGNASVVLVAPDINSSDYEATVWATPIGTNAANAVSNAVAIRLLGPAPPVADFTITPDAVTAASQAAFDGSPSTFGAGVPAKEFRWSFGDGTGDVVGQIVAHTFAVAGVYPVSLTVTDQLDRTSSKVVIIQVN